MATYAVIKDGVVDNLVEWDGDESGWMPPEGSSAVLVNAQDRVSIGAAYASNELKSPD